MTKHLQDQREGARETVPVALHVVCADCRQLGTVSSDCTSWACMHCGRTQQVRNSAEIFLASFSNLEVIKRDDKNWPYFIQGYNSVTAGKEHIATCYTKDTADALLAILLEAQNRWNTQPEAERNIRQDITSAACAAARLILSEFDVTLRRKTNTATIHDGAKAHILTELIRDGITPALTDH